MPEFRERAALFGDQLPRNSNGTMRPKLANVPWITVHYTGSNVNYGDFDDSPAEIRGIQAYAVSAKKPWEYNYVLDTQGVMWCYAGEYQAAHSAGENSKSVGVLWLLGVNDNPTDAMIETFRWFRWVMVQFGLVAVNHEVRPHKNMPGAATICPGDRVMARWNDLMVPWNPNPVPPSPPPDPGDQYKWLEPNCQFMLQPGDSPWSVATAAYGSGGAYQVLVDANPGPWTVGRQVVVPNANGVKFKVRPGDSPWKILADVWPGQSPAEMLPTFYRWNGSENRVLAPGDIVYCPARKV